jgi:pimeloyl-ACP methyl ester carboxylesterase
MAIQFVASSDGTSIAYDVTGTSSIPLILLHGFSNNRHLIWHDLGWTASLSEQFTVITLDLRGCGQSTRYSSSGRYTVAATCEDVFAVADACEIERFCTFGFSFGATVALHLAARSERPQKIISAGTRFGQLFTDRYIDNWLRRIARSDQAKQTEEKTESATSAENDLAVTRARINALRDWPEVEPENLKCQALIYTGTEDTNFEMKVAQREKIEMAGHQFVVFEGLDHLGLVRDIRQVLPQVLSFLQE